MPHTDSSLPFSGALTVSRHASYLGAEDATERALPQVLRYLALLKAVYPDGLTDAEAAGRMGLERTSINARREGCVKAGLVEAYGYRAREQSGLKNTVWRWAR